MHPHCMQVIGGGQLHRGSIETDSGAGMAMARVTKIARADSSVKRILAMWWAGGCGKCGNSFDFGLGSALG